jgi:hypothetical protein
MRADISDKLVHFTNGENQEEAYDRLASIVSDMRISGSSNLIRGSYICVCFTEAPLVSMRNGLVNPHAYTRYSPFGIMFQKRWIFKRGGRPVIYQPDAEYDLLPEEMRWRHVRYEPDNIDFTWEREWRMKCDYLDFDPSKAVIVVPNDNWAQRMIDEHETEQDYRVQEYSLIFDEDIARSYREGFPWRIYTLG